MTLLDAPNIRAHHKAAGAQNRGSFEERDHREALGCSRSSYGTKVCVTADENGKALGFALTFGRPLALGMINSLPAVPVWVMADKGYVSDAFSKRIWDIGARPAIPAKRRSASFACPRWAYRCRHMVENL